MKKMLLVIAAIFLSGCGQKIEGTYSNNLTGIAEQKISLTFSPSGTYRISIGGTDVPLEVVYKVDGKKIIAGDADEISFSILDNGDLIGNGLRFVKETSAKTTQAAPDASKPLEPAKTVVEGAPKDADAYAYRTVDIKFCRELSAKTRIAKPGQFAGDADFLPSLNACYKLAKDTGETIVWFEKDK